MQTNDELLGLFRTALGCAADAKNLDFEISDDFDFGLERPKDENHGDFACTLALRLAKS